MGIIVKVKDFCLRVVVGGVGSGDYGGLLWR